MKAIKHSLLALALGVAAAGAFAQASGPGGTPGQGPMAHGGHPGMGPGMMDPARRQQMHEERRAKRLAELKTVLQISPAQEGAWNAFTGALKPPANMSRPQPGEMEKLTTPERIDRMRAMRTERQAHQDKVADATKAFYAQLNAEQKKSFDVVSARFMRKGHGGPGMHGGHGGHGGPGMGHRG